MWGEVLELFTFSGNSLAINHTGIVHQTAFSYTQFCGVFYMLIIMIIIIVTFSDCAEQTAIRDIYVLFTE